MQFMLLEHGHWCWAIRVTTLLTAQSLLLHSKQVPVETQWRGRLLWPLLLTKFHKKYLIQLSCCLLGCQQSRYECGFFSCCGQECVSQLRVSFLTLSRLWDSTVLTSLIGVIAVLGLDMSAEATSYLLLIGAGVFVYVGATELGPCLLSAQTVTQVAVFFIAFVVGAVVVGLPLLEHKHCEVGAHAHAHWLCTLFWLWFFFWKVFVLFVFWGNTNVSLRCVVMSVWNKKTKNWNWVFVSSKLFMKFNKKTKNVVHKNKNRCEDILEFQESFSSNKQNRRNSKYHLQNKTKVQQMDNLTFAETSSSCSKAQRAHNRHNSSCVKGVLTDSQMGDQFDEENIENYNSEFVEPSFDFGTRSLCAPNETTTKVDWLIDWLMDWSIDWLIDWWMDWLVVCDFACRWQLSTIPCKASYDKSTKLVTSLYHKSNHIFPRTVSTKPLQTTLKRASPPFCTSWTTRATTPRRHRETNNTKSQFPPKQPNWTKPRSLWGLMRTLETAMSCLVSRVSFSKHKNS